MIAARRLTAQLLAGSHPESPDAVVARLGAIQAQDLAGTKWAVGVRLPGATEAAIDAALDDGSVLRTHAMRGTWQLVVPADVRWILALVGPRVIASAAIRYRQLGLDARTIARAVDVVAKTADAGHATRKELAAALEAAGISPAGQRLSHLLQHAELEGVIVNGMRRGKQTTHALLDARAPAAKPLPRDEAIAALADRYFRTRGPATAADFAWWSGLTAADARAGLEAVKSGLVRSEVDGRVLWGAAAPATGHSVLLLPAFDEYLVAYKDRTDALDAADVKRVNAGGGLLAPTIVVDGRVIGTWSRTVSRDAVRIDLAPFSPVRAALRKPIAAACTRYAAFLGLALEA